jgi:dihydroflavonol-4-reductase
MESKEAAPVLVTGASGYVATTTISQLLAKGYKVRGTVRSLTDATSKYGFLYALPGAAERLELVAANLVDKGSFDAAAQGCEFCMHIASPFTLKEEDPERDLVIPAVQGTLNVLAACKKAGVKRVILTSSCAAITDSPVDGKVYTEDDWNMSSSLVRNPYYYSKTRAELAAWDFVEKNGAEMELVTMNPYFIVGKEMNHNKTPAPEALGESNKVLYDLMTGGFPAKMALTWGFVDVRDVATAHILAMEQKDCKGRHILCANMVSMSEAADALKILYPKAKLPGASLACGPGTALVKLASHFEHKNVATYLRGHVGKTFAFNGSKVTKYASGLTYRDSKTVIAETVQWMVESGLITFK